VKIMIEVRAAPIRVGMRQCTFPVVMAMNIAAKTNCYQDFFQAHLNLAPGHSKKYYY
jgi:hypothetical protein